MVGLDMKGYSPRWARNSTRITLEAAACGF
jgi:hypothetical protein